MTDAAPVPSFANDIAPILYKYRGQMAWRLDLASLADVTANAAIIYAQIQYDEQIRRACRRRPSRPFRSTSSRCSMPGYRAAISPEPRQPFTNVA